MKSILGIIASLSLLATLFSCSKDFKVSYLEIYPQELTTTIDDTIQLSFSIVYEGGKFEDPNLIQVEWNSSNTDIVTVNDSGLIITKALGSADVSVTCQDYISTCKITVIDTTTIQN